MPRDALHEFRELAWRAGACDMPRVVASASLAIYRGMAPAAVLDSLTRNAGYLFDAQAASERSMTQRASFRGDSPHTAGRRFLAANRRVEK